MNLVKKAKKGFTIVELVIVIAVIAILAAVLIPTFSSVITNANKSAAMQECKNEWTNYLSEIATTDYTEDTFTIVYYDGGYESGTAKYSFTYANGEFNTEATELTSYTEAGLVYTGVDSDNVKIYSLAASKAESADGASDLTNNSTYYAVVTLTLTNNSTATFYFKGTGDGTDGFTTSEMLTANQYKSNAGTVVSGLFAVTVDTDYSVSIYAAKA